VVDPALAEAEQARNQMWQTFADFFQQFDYLLTPCMAIPPFPVEQNYPETIGGKPMNSYIDWAAPTFLLSLTGF
ncbi:MAG: amidase family protein, partial [Spirochaetota bacterium]